MPDHTQSTELLELRTVFPPGRREVETVHIRQKRTAVEDKIDLYIVINEAIGYPDGNDYNGHTSYFFGHWMTKMIALVNDLDATYASARFAISMFREDLTYPAADYAIITRSVTGNAFVDAATACAILATLNSNFTPHYVAYRGYRGFNRAINQSLKVLPRVNSQKAMFLVSYQNDMPASPAAEEPEALYQLLRKKVVFFAEENNVEASGPEVNIHCTTTGGIRTTQPGNPSDEYPEIGAQLVGVLRSIDEDLLEPIYLVNDTQPWTANLETGDLVTFANRSFVLNPFTSGEDGALSISLTIDNADFAVSRYLARAKLNPVELEVTFRVYASDDTTGPLNTPPLRLYATEFETKGAQVSCQLHWLDLQNAPFPNAFYTPQRSPSLQ